MKQLIFSVFLSLAFMHISAQETKPAAASSSTYKGSCHDNNGRPVNPADLANRGYSVRKFSSETPVEINIRSFSYGAKKINVFFAYKNSIQGETPVLSLNDTIGVKLVIGKVIENNLNKYVYKMMAYKKDVESKCWRPLSLFSMFSDVYEQTLSLNFFTIGLPGTSDYFQVTEGWIKLN